MANVWNEFELKKPPLITLHVENTAFAKHVFVAINKYLQQLSEPDALEFDKTAALIGRLMARRKNSFRSMIGFRAVCKLNSALCRLLRLDLRRELEHFRGALPDVCDEELAGELPTASYFEYVLVRLLGAYYIHQRIQECCVSAARYFGAMLSNNFFMEFLTLLIAAIAKINKLSEGFSNKCATLYNRLVPHRQQFPRMQNHNFLQGDDSLPKQLKVIQLPQPEKKTDAPIVTAKPPLVITKLEKAKLRAKADVGTVVARKPNEQSANKFNADALSNVEDVKMFIKRESKARTENPKGCVTKAILKHEWLAAQTLFERKLKAKEDNKAVNIFRKFICSKI